LPIIENTILDVTSEEVQQSLITKVPTEFECFQSLLQANDHKIKLAVLFLIGQQKNLKYKPLVEMMKTNEDERIEDFAIQTLKKLLAD
jgi:AAA family ATP:ADP antiporter